MANLVSVERATLALGTTLVLADVSLGVNAGGRIGVVGRNGGGKSTLLKVLAGRQEVDEGRVTNLGGLTCGMLTQVDTLDPAATVRTAVLGTLPEHVWAGDARVRDVLEGLLGGIDAPDVGGLEAVVGPMSGGERRRLALAQLLVSDPDLLLLDEPTNHLDVEGVAWLADHLSTRRTRTGTALVAVTHDRWFLDAVGHDHLGGGRGAGPLLRRRLRGVRAGQGGARPRGGRHRGAQRQPDAQGAGLAAAWAAGAHEQAQVPHRGSLRADRGRAAGRATRSTWSASPRPASARTWSTSSTRPSPWAAATCCSASPGGWLRGTGSASSGSTARASRR